MKRTATLFTCLALLIPGAAVASANSTGTSYSSNNTGHKVDNAKASKSPSKSTTPTSSSTAPAAATQSPSAVQDTTATRAASTGSLPFTGLDVGALAAGAIVLLGAGVVLRRVTATERR